MKCVKCKGILQSLIVNGVPVDQCNRCRGIWFDEGELDWLVNIYKLAISDTYAEDHSTYDKKTGKCPRCMKNSSMVQLLQVHGDFHIELCPVCGGRWCDAGELRHFGMLGTMKNY